MKKNSINKAFTLMELITVVIIISIIAAFAIPNYQNSVDKAHEKDVVANLRAIASAEQIYKSENGTYWPTWTGFPFGWTVDINNALRLGIIQNQTIYACFALAGPPDVITCQGGPAPWRVAVVSATGWIPYCYAGTCPTCQDLVGGGCPN